MRPALFTLALLALAGCTKSKPPAPKEPERGGPAGVFGNNKLDDVFTVKSIAGGAATLEGAPKDLKAGDTLFFARSPFRFAVTGVQGSAVTISLGSDTTDLAVGNTLFRYENDRVHNAIDSEKRLKEAVGD